MTKEEYFESYRDALPEDIINNGAKYYENLGFSYATGFIKPDNPDDDPMLLAYECFCIATALGDAIAPERLGAMYQYGDGVGINIKEALEYYKLSLSRGNVYAQELIDNLEIEGHSFGGRG